MASQLTSHPRLECATTIKCSTNFSTHRDWVLPGLDDPRMFLRDKVKELAQRQKSLQLDRCNSGRPKIDLTNTDFKETRGSNTVDVAYNQCRELFLIKNDAVIIGSLLMNQQKQKGFWAIYAWGRRLDEMVDGPNRSFATHDVLDRIEERVYEIYQGRPRDIYDVALADTVSRYPVDIQAFKDVIDGVRMDLTNKRFENFEEHYLYRYYSGAAFLFPLIQVMGIAPESTMSIETLYDYMMTLGIALTFVDMLTDIDEDAKAGRIYFSQEELKLAGISEEEIFNGKVTDKWKKFMREQIKRVKALLDEGEKGINELNFDARWALWTSVLVYRQELKAIEANDYDVFSKKPKAGQLRKMASLAMAYAKSQGF